MKNHTLRVRVDSQTEQRLRNYCLRMRREKSDALRILLTNALDAEDGHGVCDLCGAADRKLVDLPGEYKVEATP